MEKEEKQTLLTRQTLTRSLSDDPPQPGRREGAEFAEEETEAQAISLRSCCERDRAGVGATLYSTARLSVCRPRPASAGPALHRVLTAGDFRSVNRPRPRVLPRIDLLLTSAPASDHGKPVPPMRAPIH